MHPWLLYGGFILINLVFFRLLLRKWRIPLNRKNEINVKGKVVIVTGSTSGIGRAAAISLADRDANVILACRNLKKTKETIESIRQKTSRGQLIPMELDLASLKSVRKFAKEFKEKYTKLDILINNAGLMVEKGTRKYTEDGFEMHMGVNHVGHFLLTNLLLDELKNAAPSRIVTVSSMAHAWADLNIDDLMSEKQPLKDYFMVSGLYSNSKMANALFSKELSKRLTGTGVKTYSLCPGGVYTDIGNNLDIPFIMRIMYPLSRYFVRTPDEYEGSSRPIPSKMQKMIFEKLTKTSPYNHCKSQNPHFCFLMVMDGHTPSRAVNETRCPGAATVLYCALSKDVANESGQMYRDCKRCVEWTRDLKDQEASKLWDVTDKLVGKIK